MIIVSKQNQDWNFTMSIPYSQGDINSDLAGIPLLMGNLQFQNEVGYSTFEIRYKEKTLLEVTLEIFPTKLDYRKIMKDY